MLIQNSGLKNSKARDFVTQFLSYEVFFPPEKFHASNDQIFGSFNMRL
jgi:hypothetical protein